MRARACRVAEERSGLGGTDLRGPIRLALAAGCQTSVGHVQRRLAQRQWMVDQGMAAVSRLLSMRDAIGSVTAFSAIAGRCFALREAGSRLGLPPVSSAGTKAWQSGPVGLYGGPSQARPWSRRRVLFLLLFESGAARMRLPLAPSSGYLNASWIESASPAPSKPKTSAPHTMANEPAPDLFD